MATNLVVRNVDEDVALALKQLAASHGRSAEAERYSSSVVALDIATGAVRWVFQTVHHDLWDYDVPSQPSLIDLEIDGRTAIGHAEALWELLDAAVDEEDRS